MFSGACINAKVFRWLFRFSSLYAARAINKNLPRAAYGVNNRITRNHAPQLEIEAYFLNGRE